MGQTREDLAALLTNARRNNTTIGRRPQIVPASLDEAYRISARTVEALGEPVAGWKVGVGEDGRGIGAPMLASGMRLSGGEWRRRVPGPLLVEVELAFRLSRDLPARSRRYSRAEIMEACGAALVGLELIESRFGDPDGLPPALALADQLSNAGFVSGEEVTNISGAGFPHIACRIWTDDALCGERNGSYADDRIATIEAWAACQVDGLGGLKAGHIITTGALIPPVRLDRPAKIRGTIEGIGEVLLDVF